MSFEREIIKQGDTLVIRYHGEYTDQTFEEGTSIFNQLKMYCRQEDCSKALIDAREISVDLNVISLFRIGEKVAESTKSIQLAILANVEDEFFENVAYNRGANMRIFTSESRASNWLDNNDIA